MRYSYFALVLLAAGCSHWEQRRLDQPTPMRAADPVWIWSGGKVEKWQAVIITTDSVSGIPYGTPLVCDSCRRSIPRALVDSMKVAYQTEGGVKGVGGTVLVLTGALVAVLLLEFVGCATIGPAFGGCKQ